MRRLVAWQWRCSCRSAPTSPTICPTSAAAPIRLPGSVRPESRPLDQLQIAISVVLIIAGIIGGWLATIGGPVLVALGVASVLAALAYTGGPFPYGYHGLGEVFVFVFFGLVAVIG